jgi:preprotein translocase subunit SecD
MKKIFLSAVIIFIHIAGFSQKSTVLKDGFYEVYQFSNDSTAAAGKNQQWLRFNHNFKEDAPKDYAGVIVYTNALVPLELEKLPELETKSGLTARLKISLTHEAAAKLENFTRPRIMKEVAIIMDGEVLTVHKIRTVITGKSVEISRCNDSACEKLQIMLKDNVKH